MDNTSNCLYNELFYINNIETYLTFDYTYSKFDWYIIGRYSFFDHYALKCM